MARDRLTFRQRDVTAAVKAVRDAGLSISRVLIRKDGVHVIPGEPPAIASEAEDDRTPGAAALDKEVEEYEAKRTGARSPKR